jgi:hypothetical protein
LDTVSRGRNIDGLVRRVKGSGYRLIIDGDVTAKHFEESKAITKARWFNSSAVIEDRGITDEGEVGRIVAILNAGA